MYFRTALAVALACIVSACGNSRDADTFPYNATLTRTSLGIPHVTAEDYGSIGYGLGYATAEDNLCVLMDDIITNRGERARYFGRAGSYSIPANGTVAANVDSDFFWRLANTDAAIAPLKNNSLPEARLTTRGFAAGFNRYIREIRNGDHPGRHAACGNAEWLAPISEDDMYRRYFRLALIASSSVFGNDIARAQPPIGGGDTGEGGSSAPDLDTLVAALRADPGPLAYFTQDRPFGSNMYALSKDATASGQSMVFGNPHFPWSGTERLYISHLTIPGALDIMGSSLYGVPAVLIGFNDHFAWSHTVSTAFRFTFYELTLAPGDPTSYVHEGAVRKMQAVPITIQVREEDGSITEQSRTLYRSHYGPMTGLTVSGQNILPWTAEKAYTLRDANAENDRLINQFFLWNRARSLDEFKALHKSVLGIPWVNTIASGPNGKAYYGDVSVVPHVTNGKAQSCSTSVQAQALAALAPGVYVLDGSRAACDWGEDADAPAKGIFGPGNLPTMERDDWVHNCNDSYWLTNPAQPITGYNRIIGAENSERSLRTRLCIQQVLRHLDQPGNDGLGSTFDADSDKRFTLKELQDTVLSSQIYSGQLARDDVVADICAAGMVMTQAGPVDVGEACAVLEGWNLNDNLESVGGHVWREFFRIAAGLNGRWLTAFSASDPVNTPRNLNTASPQVQEALGTAVRRIQNAGVAMNAPLGSLQRSGVIGNEVIPIFGGEGFEGAFTIVNTRPQGAISDKGYPITYGNSYIQTVTWEPDSRGFKPIAEGFVTYSQSTDPASPHFFDFTSEYSAKRWKRFPFRPAEIEADMISRIRLTN
jgi:acyl-homoserine-lactone acylase